VIVEERFLNKIEFDLTTKCNYRCIYCAAAASVNCGDSEISVDLFKNIISQIKYKTEVKLIGGEPLVYFQNKEYLYDLIFDNNFIYPTFVTNGSLIHKQKKLINHLQNNNFTMSVSMEGVGENYERLRKNGSWKQIINNITLISDIIKSKNFGSPSFLNIQYIATKTTINDLMDFIKVAEEVGVDMISIIHLLYSKSAEDIYNTKFEELFIEDPNFYYEKVKEVYDYLNLNKSNLSFSFKSILGKKDTYISEIYKNKKYNYDKLLDIEGLPKEYVDISCANQLQFVINSDSTISPCCGGRNLIMGNCKEDNIYDIFNNMNYQKLRTDLSTGVKPEYCCCTEVHENGNYSGADSSLRVNKLENKYKNYINTFNVFKEKNIDESIEFLEGQEKELYSFDTNSTLIWNELAGVYLYRKSDYDKANEYIDRILKIRPDNTAAIIKKAIILVNTEKYDQAIDVLNGIDKDKNILSYYWIGYALEKQKKKENSKKYYTEFIKLCDEKNELKDTWGYQHALEVIENG